MTAVSGNPDTGLTVSSPNPTAGGSRTRRDKLLSIEQEIQRKWTVIKPYEIDTGKLPRQETGSVCNLPGQNSVSNGKQPKNKFFCSFPYPYMNGTLHLGHSFTICRAEFQARYNRLLGKNVLWPFALHCTGMPILACADKLKRELEARRMENVSNKRVDDEAPIPSEAADPTKFSGSKSKLVAKTGNVKTQWQIMQSMGIPDCDIPKFSDANYWLEYFPPLCIEDVKRLGCAVDWRRSFITTDVNPYYDAFVRWQFLKLMERSKIKFGMRPTIISPRELQACADHDRMSGEGVTPQEYTLIKLKVQFENIDATRERLNAFKSNYAKHLKPDVSVYLVAATLRPETMYGQTNCFILPEGEYGVYIAFGKPRISMTKTREDISPSEMIKLAETSATELGIAMSREEALNSSICAFVCSERSAMNMAYQGIIPLEPGTVNAPHCLWRVKGEDLIGVPLSAPNAAYSTVYGIPMQSISMEKGTGIVTSVPSDSPDDFANLTYIKTKVSYFDSLYGFKKEWVEPFEPVAVMEVPGLGPMAAVTVYNEKKIQGPKDTVKLQEAKEEVYKRGFYEGVMIVGNHKGKKVVDAKNLIRDEMVENSEAVVYYEPERKVVSRSGDDCVVGYLNQWYLDYGEEKWRKMIEDFVTSPEFSTYNVQALNQFQFVISWLKEWACSRSYGLGTFLPWTTSSPNPVLIESLSDSTIYMAYYTISHLLQGGDIYGKSAGPLGIRPEQLTEEFFDYVFMVTDTMPSNCDISKENLSLLRKEFSYWYPLDLRVSGKDLIFNHLTFCLYNHAAIWPSSDMWPRAFVSNGMIMVDSEKMSKSAGNFLSLKGVIGEYSADATRIALADAGDSMDDANFQRETANAAVMRLFLLEQFVSEFCSGSMALRNGPMTTSDDFFSNEMKKCVIDASEGYTQYQYRQALKASFFDFSAFRDQYRVLCGAAKMHSDLVKQWIEIQALILSPIAPHICEHIWSVLLKNETSVVNEEWPFSFSSNFDPVLHRKFELLMSAVEDYRKSKDKAVQAMTGGKKKAPKVETPPVSLTHGVVYVAREYGALQQTVLKILKTIPLERDANGIYSAPADFMNLIKSSPDILALDKNAKKEAMAFASFQMKDELKACGPSALELSLPFDEMEILQVNKDYIVQSLGLEDVEIRLCSDVHPQDSTNSSKLARPGRSSIYFYA